MDIIQRNFFRLLRSGALNEFEQIEPMSAFKWNRLIEIVKAQDVVEITLKGLKNHGFDKKMNITPELTAKLESYRASDPATQGSETYLRQEPASELSNPLFKRRLEHIRQGERHAIDCSIETLRLLDILIENVNSMLTKGISLKLILELGFYLRTKGDKVDFVKLDRWLEKLHMGRMAQLEGSILVSVFDFEKDELPFVNQVEKGAHGLVMRSLRHTEKDTAEEWHFRQSRTGFVRNNSSVMRRNLKRSMKYFNYAPIETTSNFISNFARSLSEIEE